MIRTTAVRRLALVAALALAGAVPAYAAAPLKLDKHQGAVEKVAPPYPTIPGRTMCVCLSPDSFRETHVGYLNSFLLGQTPNSLVVTTVCTYPLFDLSGVQHAVDYCTDFSVIK